MTQRLCPDCGGEMEAGFVPDFSYGTVMQTCWHAGIPKDQTFFGMKIGAGSIKYDREKMSLITTYRCTKCHVLRSYTD